VPCEGKDTEKRIFHSTHNANAILYVVDKNTILMKPYKMKDRCDEVHQKQRINYSYPI